jgi:uncharacterized protein YbjT (DUF2867 family)
VTHQPKLRILLTGANGYIGRRLLPVLVAQGHHVFCLLRDKRRIEVEESLLSHITFIEADLAQAECVAAFPADIDVAYYLVHSLGVGSSNFDDLEYRIAEHFISGIKNTSCRHIIYLSGIANSEGLSKHLNSRAQVEKILMNGPVPVTVLRAAIIIGSGGASFEIIRDLVEKLPVMVAPKWLNTRCQPIAVRNVIHYLHGIMLKEEAYHRIFDIGGPDVLTYKQMLLQFAEARGLKRWIITVPVLTPRLSSYWLHFVTATSFNIARNLVDSMMNEVVVERYGIEEIVPQQLIGYKEAVQMAFDKIAQNEVLSSWKDAVASSKINPQLLTFAQVPVYGCFVDRQQFDLEEDPSRAIRNIWRIGGDQGWYYWNFLWKVRGYLDKAIGGVGLRRGRRSPDQLVAGDALDFWRVLIADKQQMRLLLYAEMKLPGEAWLEFKIKKTADHQFTLFQTATFRPQGVWGRLYWYSVLPFHLFIFKGMIHQIATRND